MWEMKDLAVSDEIRCITKLQYILYYYPLSIRNTGTFTSDATPWQKMHYG